MLLEPSHAAMNLTHFANCAHVLLKPLPSIHVLPAIIELLHTVLRDAHGQTTKPWSWFMTSEIDLE